MPKLSTAVESSTLGTHSFESYAPLIGEDAIERILRKADRLRGAHIVHISSTFYGGSVTEILTPLTLLMNDMHIETGWRELSAEPSGRGLDRPAD